VDTLNAPPLESISGTSLNLSLQPTLSAAAELEIVRRLEER
jgi:hypothetical protein